MASKKSQAAPKKNKSGAPTRKKEKEKVKRAARVEARKGKPRKQPAPKPLPGEKRPPGRPTDYRPEYDEAAYRACVLGATDAVLADKFGVDERTINEWKQKHESFSQSIARGKRVVDEDVAVSLLDRARGGLQKVEKGFKCKRGTNNEVVVLVEETVYIPPDTTACSLWLRNRQPELWRDKVEVATSDNDLPAKLIAAQKRLDLMK